MAVTDDERREVARRLRELAGGYVTIGEMEDALGICMSSPTVDLERDARDLHRLADLIEPDCDRDTPQKVAEEMFGKMRHSTREEADAYEAMLKSKSVEIHPVDRDALLELADELSGDTLTVPAVFGTYMGGYVAACQDVARRIREALGVES